MRLKEFNFKKSKTPQQQRIDSLQKQKENLEKQLKAERNTQKLTKARQTIASIKSPF
jgi:flagellar capping protein FliD